MPDLDDLRDRAAVAGRRWAVSRVRAPRKPASGFARIAGGVALFVACVVGAVVLGWVGYALYAWNGYGSAQVDRLADAGLDHFMPVYEIAERHEVAIDAPWTNTYAAECLVDLQDSPVIRSIFRSREIILHASPDPDADQQPSSFLAQALSLGWGVLAEDPGHEIIVGAITQPWEPNVIFQALPPDQFAGFQTPGYAKIVWTLDAEPTGPSTSIARTVTRVVTTDPVSREKFRRYWATFSPGILLIRYQALDLVRDAAERGYRSNGSAAPKTCAEIESAARG